MLSQMDLSILGRGCEKYNTLKKLDTNPQHIVQKNNSNNKLSIKVEKALQLLLYAQMIQISFSPLIHL